MRNKKHGGRELIALSVARLLCPCRQAVGTCPGRHVTSETPGTSRPVTGAGSPIPPSRALKEPWEATESGSLDSSSWMDVRKYSDSIFLELEGPFERPVCLFAYPAVSALHPALDQFCSLPFREPLGWCHRHPPPACILWSANTKPYILDCNKSLFNCLEEEIHLSSLT